MNLRSRTYAEINFAALENNLNSIRKSLPEGCKICAPVKANAYGHGAVDFSLKLEELGVDFFGVASLSEAVELRRGGIKGEILILGFGRAEDAKYLAKHNIIQSVYSLNQAIELERECQKIGEKVAVHIKVDTGMGRIGFRCCSSDEAARAETEITEISSFENLMIEGIFTHFSSAGFENDNYTENQYNQFNSLVSKLSDKGINFKYRHSSNSSAVINHAGFSGNMVRPGLILYGIYPEKYMEKQDSLGLIPVMSLKTTVADIRHIKKGGYISYDRTYMLEKDAMLATAPAGYADGYMRALSNKAEVLIRGKRAKIRGRVCMDQIVFDVTGIDEAKPGDSVLLFGRMDDKTVSVTELAEIAGTISYEILTGISPRVPRIFLYEE